MYYKTDVSPKTHESYDRFNKESIRLGDTWTVLLQTFCPTCCGNWIAACRSKLENINTEGMSKVVGTNLTYWTLGFTGPLNHCLSSFLWKPQCIQSIDGEEQNASNFNFVNIIHNVWPSLLCPPTMRCFLQLKDGQYY